MADANGTVRARLDELFAKAESKDPVESFRGRALLTQELNRVLYCMMDQSLEAREWIIDLLKKAPNASLEYMAYGEGHEENKRAAGIVLVLRAAEIKDTQVVSGLLETYAKDLRLNIHARMRAGSLLAWQTSQGKDAALQSRMRMLDERFPRETRVAFAEVFMQKCLESERTMGVATELVTGGEWPEVAAKFGRQVVDHYSNKGNGSEVKRIANARGTPTIVKEYAQSKLGSASGTLLNMPAVRVDNYRRKLDELRKIPPSPQQIRRKETLKGPVK